jgi:hypothetical protein
MELEQDNHESALNKAKHPMNTVILRDRQWNGGGRTDGPRLSGLVFSDPKALPVPTARASC